jgi:long-subunit acyl-CoA synthetase (AMP-forming)
MNFMATGTTPFGRVGNDTCDTYLVAGPNLTRGYFDNPEANLSSFVDGWFRTGDQGFLDSDGYLFLTGRIKEIINRGGEKISPREIECAAHRAGTRRVQRGTPHVPSV